MSEAKWMSMRNFVPHEKTSFQISANKWELIKSNGERKQNMYNFSGGIGKRVNNRIKRVKP